MTSSSVVPMGQEERPTCSVPLIDADLALGNANWTKGLQAMSDWIWSGNLNPVAFPNNLGRFFLQIPAVFEHQLQFSTTLIFDEPSFRNGIQVSGFLDRPIRELVINLIGQRRRSWYTMTHHAVLGTLTAHKHGIPNKVFAKKLVLLTDHEHNQDVYTALEREVLRFADAFATNPKAWTDADCEALKGVLREENRRRYANEFLWMASLEAARAERRRGNAMGETGGQETPERETGPARVRRVLPDDLNERIVNAALVELAFLCVQFIALTDMFSGLNIPDEPFLADVMTGLLQPEVISRVNALNAAGGNGLPALIPPTVQIPIDAIIAGRTKVEPARLKGARVPLTSYEVDTAQATRDKGLAVGGVQTGVWGWSFGSYFPGGLVYLLMHHPELARFEAPYSLPLLFNEDEWRNGTQTGGYVSRRLKEIVYLKIYTTTRSRYGLEHHTMFLFNMFLDEYGVGRPPNPDLTEAEQKVARKKAIEHAEKVVVYVQDPAAAPDRVFTKLELAAMQWVGRLITHPHSAYTLEPDLRRELDSENRREVKSGVRRLDVLPGESVEPAYRRLIDHQIAELAMLSGHMDGLGRAMTMLHLESEEEVKTADGFMTNRPGLFQVYDFIGVSEKARTSNELRLNPELVTSIMTGKTESPVSSNKAVTTAEF